MVEPIGAAAWEDASRKKDGTDLSFWFRGRSVPVTYPPSIPTEQAQAAVNSGPFVTWYERCQGSLSWQDNSTTKRIEIHSVEIQSIDMFGARGVGFIKMKSHCTLVDGKTRYEHRLPGICFLRGNAVAIMVALFCQDGSSYTLLVDQPRVPIGQASVLELPAGMMDDNNKSVSGIAISELQEECGIVVDPDGLVDLTALAWDDDPETGIPPSPGGCDEFVRFFYLEKKVTVEELQAIQGRLTGLRDHGEYITLRVVPLADAWKVSRDAKTIICAFLVERLRNEGKLPPAGDLATPLTMPTETGNHPL